MPDPNPSSVLPYVPTRADSDAFDQLKELIANGYVADPGAPGEAGILLRHKAAPDLILHADGRLEVPIGQPAKSVRRFLDWRRWLKILALVIFGGIFWLVSLGFTMTLLESLEGL
jgi:hypothetical protein